MVTSDAAHDTDCYLYSIYSYNNFSNLDLCVHKNCIVGFLEVPSF